MKRVLALLPLAALFAASRAPSRTVSSSVPIPGGGKVLGGTCPGGGGSLGDGPAPEASSGKAISRATPAARRNGRVNSADRVGG